jgi:diguanylate cyclase (GGDEF)-like protein
MKLVGRHDLFLLGGLAVALFVVFSQALEQLFDRIHAIEETSGLRLLPALVILAGVFVFHQLRKRHEIRAEALAAAAAARQATDRAAEMERLVVFGQALARSLNEEAIEAAAAAHMPLLAPGRDAWVLVRTATEWRPLLTTPDRRASARERAARMALGDADPSVADDDFTCFPMIIAGTPIGVLGVAAAPPLHDQARRTLTAAAALLAVSLKNAQLFREVHEHSVRDSLTGCFNRRHALEVIDAELRRSRRSGMPLSMLMFDLDHFKRINDRYGHLAGDAVLAAIGGRMKAVLRGSDMKCRYGGEEFLVLLPDTPLPGAQRVAETLRAEIHDHPVDFNDERLVVSASFGVTTVTPGELDALAVMARADSALYRAKQDGRNCVRTSAADASVSRPRVSPAQSVLSA